MKCTCNMKNTRRTTHLASCDMRLVLSKRSITKQLRQIGINAAKAQQFVIEYACSNCAQPIYFSVEERLWFHTKNHIRNCAIPYFPFATPRVKVIK